MEEKEKEQEQKEDNTRVLKLKDDTRVPGATTILKLLDKPFLVKWANNLGKKGVDVTEYVTHSASVGDLIHTIIQSHLLHTEVDISKYSDYDLKTAEDAFYRYLEWENQHTIENIEIEKKLVSETYKYGGFLDIYCKVDGKWTIIDIKTSKQINTEQRVQVSCYEQLVKENNLKVDQILIINTGKSPDSKLQVEEIAMDKVSKYFKFFKALLDVYYVQKEIGWDE